MDAYCLYLSDEIDGVVVIVRISKLTTLTDIRATRFLAALGVRDLSSTGWWRPLNRAVCLDLLTKIFRRKQLTRVSCQQIMRRKKWWTHIPDSEYDQCECRKQLMIISENKSLRMIAYYRRHVGGVRYCSCRRLTLYEVKLQRTLPHRKK